MATWPDLKQYILANYKIAQDIGNGLKLQFGLEGGRSQLVFVTHYSLMDGREDWAVIDSPIGELGKVNLTQAVVAAGDMVCGGVSVLRELVTLTHAVPLANLDLNEFERPFSLLITSADRLESILTGRDDF